MRRDWDHSNECPRPCTPNSKPAQRPSQFCSAVDGHLLAGYRINSNLTAKEQLILVANIETEDACVFEEKLALLRNKDFERRQIEWFEVDVGIGKIGVPREIQERASSLGHI